MLRRNKQEHLGVRYRLFVLFGHFDAIKVLTRRLVLWVMAVSNGRRA